jgi:O-antigen/teichoic acid export membrane protein
MDRKLGIQQLFSLISNGAPAVMALLSFRLLNQTLGVDAFGLYLLITAAFGIFVQLRLGIISAAYIKLASGKSYSSDLTGSAWVTALITCLLFVLITAGTSVLSSIESATLLPISLLAFTAIPSFVAAILLQSRENFRGIAIIRLVESGSFMLGIWCFQNQLSQASTALWILLASSATSSLLVLILGWSNIRCIPSATKRSLQAIWEFGKFTSGTQIITSLIINTDVFLIQFFLGTASVTYFEVGRKWLEVFEVPFRSLSSVYYARISGMINQGKSSQLWRFITTRALRTSGIALLFIPIFFFSAPVLISLLGGERFQDSIDVFRILLFLPLLIPMDRFYGLSLDALGQPRLNFYKGLILLLVNLLLDATALHLGFGIQGVAVVSIMFYCNGGLLSVFWLRRSLLRENH